MKIRRRDFLAGASGALAAPAALVPKAASGSNETSVSAGEVRSSQGEHCRAARAFNGRYSGEHLERIAFPLGGIGAGMVCLEGTGALTQFSLRHTPDLLAEPEIFAALSIKEQRRIAKVLEGPVPMRKRFPDFLNHRLDRQMGLPRFNSAEFAARFPFATIHLTHQDLPLDVQVTGWSPFEPGQEDDSSLPVAALEYQFTNRSDEPVDGVFSFHSANFLKDGKGTGRITSCSGGFVLEGTLENKPWTTGSLAVFTDDSAVRVNHAWPDLGWGVRYLHWDEIERGAYYDRAPLSSAQPSGARGASLFVPFALEPRQTKTVKVHFAWYVPRSNLRLLGGGGAPDGAWKPHFVPAENEECYVPWYASRFTDIRQVCDYWRERYQDLRKGAEWFSTALFGSTLPPVALEAVAANLSTLKSPTVLRQNDGKLWGWEGSGEESGIGAGSCTHVWNYAQALPHLFPRLERTLRDTEFGVSQNEQGHQAFRSALPIRPSPHDFPAAADGQLGGIIKVFRDWRISGDTDWLRGLWPKVSSSLDYCIRTWDPRRVGWLEEPQHWTFDTELWGPNSLCSSLYLSALKAASIMGKALGKDVAGYRKLLRKGVALVSSGLYNGSFFVQKTQWKGLKADFPEATMIGLFKRPLNPEQLAIAQKEGPPFQYGPGCLTDGVLGEWLAWTSGVEGSLDEAKVLSHLRSVHRHNFHENLSDIAHPAPIAIQACFAMGDDGGVLGCSWPNGGKPSLPTPFAPLVFSGCEYQVASHLIALGEIDKGLDIVRACRTRYDGHKRNPFSEDEAGHWYVRALSSYALLQAFSGARYDAVDKILYLKPTIKGDFRCFLSTATGYGMVGVRNGEAFVEVVAGEIPYRAIQYVPAKVEAE